MMRILLVLFYGLMLFSCKWDLQTDKTVGKEVSTLALPPSYRHFIEETIQLYNSCMKDTADYLHFDFDKPYSAPGPDMILDAPVFRDWYAFRKDIDRYISIVRHPSARTFVSKKWNKSERDRGSNSLSFAKDKLKRLKAKGKKSVIEILGDDYKGVSTKYSMRKFGYDSVQIEKVSPRAESLVYRCYNTISDLGLEDEFYVYILYDDNDKLIGIYREEVNPLPFPDYYYVLY